MILANFINPHDKCYQTIRVFASSDSKHSLVRKGSVEIAELDKAIKLPEGLDEEISF